MSRNPTPVAALGFLTVALAGALLALTGGTTQLTLILGTLVAVGAGALAVLTWRRAAPFKASTLSSQWWKFVFAGPVLIGAVILGAGSGVEAWFLGMALVLAAVASVVVGLALAVANVVSRHTPTPT